MPQIMPMNSLMQMLREMVAQLVWQKMNMHYDGGCLQDQKEEFEEFVAFEVNTAEGVADTGTSIHHELPHSVHNAVVFWKRSNVCWQTYRSVAIHLKMTLEHTLVCSQKML